MSNANDLLERYTREHIAEKLESQGYALRRDAQVDGERYDLVAEKGAERIAYEVMVPPVPDDRLRAMRARRRHWLSHGNGQFRTVFARLPQPVTVQIEDLSTQLMSALVRTPPPALRRVTTVEVDELSDVEITSVVANSSGLRVEGTCTVGCGMWDDGPGDYFEGPFRFQVHLDHDLCIAEIETFEPLTDGE